MLDRYDWTLQEQKIFLYLVSRVDSVKDKDFRKLTLTVKEFAELVGVKNRSSIYSSLEVITKKILSRVFRIETEHSITQFQALSRAKYIKKEGIVELTIHQDMMPYLLEISKNFTAYELKNITKMTSSYALRIYELVKSYERLGEITYHIDDFRKKLGINAGEFLNFAHFNKHVLSIARREINSKTDLRMEYDLIKEGRKVAYIKFKFKHINNKKGLKATTKLKSQQITLIPSGLTTVDDVASRIIESFKPSMISDNVSKPQSKIIKHTDLEKKLHDQNVVDNKKTEKPTTRKTSFMKIFQYLFKKKLRLKNQ
jgi:plasmid replication initiation protein